MATLRNPNLFSAHFGIDPDELDDLGSFDPILNTDTRLFIDPTLLKLSKSPIIKNDGTRQFRVFFGDIIRLLKASTRTGDAPWRSAATRIRTKEIVGTCLGYGAADIRGSAIGPELADRILSTAKEIVDLGIDDPDLFTLLALLEDGIGADRISDLTTKAIIDSLLRYTENISEHLNISTESFNLGEESYAVPVNPFRPTPIILVPRDVLRKLPVANSWRDVADAAAKNQELRKRVNDLIANIWQAKTRKEKWHLRSRALSSRESFEALLDAVSIADKFPYDPDADPDGHYILRHALAHAADELPLRIIQAPKLDLDELDRIVSLIIENFQRLIEDNGWWYLLWANNEPRHERAAQRLFFGVADSWCRFNDLDLSPETDSGSGSVDFKISKGYKLRVLVELKLSTGKVVHGYQTQLGIYKKAEKTMKAHYVVIDVGKLGSKYTDIQKLRDSAIKKGEPTSSIVLIDGHPRPSASVA